jgi:hypothetical protein
MPRRLLMVFLAVLGAAFVVAPLAQADTGNIIEPQNSPPTAKDGFQAITCTSDEPTKCSPETPSQFFTQAGGHPPVGFTQYIIRHGEIPAGPLGTLKPIEEPQDGRTIKTLRVDLPPGLTVNPNATPKCSLADFENKAGEFTVPLCAENTKVGREEVTLVVNTAEAVPAPSPPFPAGSFLPKGFVIPPSTEKGTNIPVYNLQPKAGEPALFGFVAAGKEVVFLETEVAWQNDFHETFRIKLPPNEPPFSTLSSRLVNFGATSGDGTYINNPTTCFDPTEAANSHLYSTWFRAESYEEEDANFPFGSTPFESKVEDNTGKAVQQTGCDTVPFTPGVDVNPGTGAIDSPAPATVDTTLKYLTGGESTQQESHLRKAVVTTPAGMGLNPSGAVGLQACTDGQFGKGNRTYTNTCPAASKIGSVEIQSAPLEKPLAGDIYVGEQKSSNPASGEMFRILVEAKEENEGIDVRLVGNVAANPTTGQLTTTFDEQEVGELSGALPRGLPQVPFTSVKLKFDGAKAVLTSPPTCAEAETTGQMEPWARPGTNVAVTSKFTLTSQPGGGTCPTTLGARKFTPTYTAKSANSQGGAYSPFNVHVGRTDGEQELKVVNATLPAGHAASLKGIPYCPDSALAAAAGKSGTAENASPSCSSASQVGVAITRSGTGSDPASLDGKVYLAGPYKGAPLSLATITPGIQGPFDVGTVVVRIALNVNPETTAVTAISDVIPDVYGGVKLDIRSIDLNLNRPNFMHNPTNCDAKAVTGVLQGGGADPTNPAAFSSYPFAVPYQATGCDSLGFKPKLVTKLLGGRKSTKRRSHPKLQAILTTRPNDANIARTVVTLPPGVLLDNGRIGTVCVKAQLAANACPSKTILGKASATSPLLDNALSGNIYLVPASTGKLPDVLVDLRGQINVQLRGVISTSKKAGLRTTFGAVPDAPVTKFTLNLNGGGKGLLVNSKDLCKQKGGPKSALKMVGQNGKKLTNNKLPLKISGCPKKKKHKK